MNRTILSIILSILFFNLQAQQVSTLVAGPSGFNDGLVQDTLGNIYASYYYGTVVTKITPAGQTSNHVTGLTDPNGLTFTPEGLLLIPEATANKITLIDTAGNKSLYANITNPSGLLFLPSGDLLVAQYTQDKVSLIDTAGNISDYWTGSELSGGPVGICYDESEKTCYLAGFDDGKILKRDSTGLVTELADLPGWCGFITLGRNYIYATAFSVHKIYRIAKDGSSVEVIAGTGSRGQINGALNQARFDNPNGILASKSGDTLFISDYGTRSLRVISDVDSIVLTTALESEDLASGISVWPNPAQKFINVFISEAQDVQFEISNLKGAVLFSENLKIEIRNSNTYRIDLPESLAPGQYLIKVITEKKIETFSFLRY